MTRLDAAIHFENLYAVRLLVLYHIFYGQTMKTTRRKSSDCFLRLLSLVGPQLLALWVLTGCSQKDVVYGLDPIPVGIEFDWQNAEGADP